MVDTFVRSDQHQRTDASGVDDSLRARNWTPAVARIAVALVVWGGLVVGAVIAAGLGGLELRLALQATTAGRPAVRPVRRLPSRH